MAFFSQAQTNLQPPDFDNEFMFLQLCSGKTNSRLYESMVVESLKLRSWNILLARPAIKVDVPLIYFEIMPALKITWSKRWAYKNFNP